MTLLEDTILENRYRIDRLLGQGGMGAIYRAFDLKLKVPVAIKENFFQTPQAIHQFEQEALILARLHHPNLPRVMDHFSFEGQQYLVMDFIEGEDLWQIVKQQNYPLDEAQAVNYISQVCEAVQYLHKQHPPIIHRDIKPQNIKLTPDGQAMLVDFGIAKLAESGERTGTGARGITPGFSPPEQYTGMGTTPASDIYSLGATLYALLTGRKPPDSISLMVGGAKFEPPEIINPRLSHGVSQAIIQAMQPQAAQRPVSVVAWQKSLRAILVEPVEEDRETLLPGTVMAPAVEPPPSGPGPAPLFWLVDSNGQGYALSQEPLVIGRHGDADIVINDPSVSRRHALIRQEGPRCLISDNNNSANGTLLNGRRLDADWYPLQPGDTLQLGSVRLSLTRQPPARLVARPTPLPNQGETRLMRDVPPPPPPMSTYPVLSTPAPDTYPLPPAMPASPPPMAVPSTKKGFPVWAIAIAVIILLALVVGGGGVIFFLRGGQANPAATTTTEAVVQDGVNATTTTQAATAATQVTAQAMAETAQTEAAMAEAAQTEAAIVAAQTSTAVTEAAGQAQAEAATATEAATKTATATEAATKTATATPEEKSEPPTSTRIPRAAATTPATAPPAATTPTAPPPAATTSAAPPPVATTPAAPRPASSGATPMPLKSSVSVPQLGAKQVTDVDFNPQNPAEVYALVKGDGLYKSVNSGDGPWARVELDGSAITGLTIDPANPARLFAPTWNAVLRSDDGGNSWQAFGNGLSAANRTVDTIALDPVNPTLLYAGIGSALVVSTDGGENWTSEGFGSGLQGGRLTSIAVDPFNHDIIYVAGEFGSIYQSVDSARTFKQLAYNVGSGVYSLVAHPGQKGVYLAGINAYDAGIIKTENGADFFSVSRGLVFGGADSAYCGLAFAPSNPAIVYAGSGNENDYDSKGIFKSADGGQSWNAINTGLSLSSGTGQPRYTKTIAVHPKDANLVLAATGGGLFKSTDGGASWSIR